MHVTFDHSDDIAKSIRMFWFRPERLPRYTAGQFIELRLPHDQPDKRGDKRWFTLSSSPTEELLAITTKFAPEAGSTFKQTLASLTPGNVVTMSEPMGDFVLPKNRSIPLVFVAGGIGVTPMRSMVKWLVDTDEQRTITLLYAARNQEELAFLELFRPSGIEFVPVVSQADASWQGATGTLDGSRIVELTNPANDTLFFLSGPEPMVEALGKSLKAEGINKRHIVTDYFPGYVQI
jgi:ferredoxin-NADP reductase